MKCVVYDSGLQHVYILYMTRSRLPSPLLPQTMFSTSPYSDPVTSLVADPQPIVDEEEGLLWVVGPVLAVIFIVCIVIAILLFKR